MKFFYPVQRTAQIMPIFQEISTASRTKDIANDIRHNLFTMSKK